MNTIPFDITEALESGIAVTGAPGSGKTTLLKFLAQRLMHEGIKVYVIDVSQAWNTNTPLQRFMKVTGKPMDFVKDSTVFDLSDLGFLQKRWWVNEFVRTLYSAHVQGYRAKEFIIFEEAQIYVPSNALRSPHDFEPLINLITVGRNFTLRYALATQFPAMADANLFKSPQQRYFGWTTEFNDVNRIRSYFPREEKDAWEKTLRRLGKLKFLYQYRDAITPFTITPYSEGN
jgi:energy-coupling factor transporter ATP-binding protein EcfA2